MGWFDSWFGSCSQRKYIDLIYEKSTKYANWDPPKEIRVGAYGTLDKKTGEFLVEGNIYDAEIQKELDKQDIDLKMADFQPVEAAVEDSLAIAAQVSENGGLNAEVTATIPGIASASIQGEWQFKHGKRGAVLVMHTPRQIYLARNGSVLEKLYHVDKLTDKHLVTSVQTCPAYSMYLSDKSGHKFSLGLVANAPGVGGGGGFKWQDKSQGGLHRSACDKKGEYKFTPLYELIRPINREKRRTRGKDEPELTGEDLWYSASPPWKTLDDDGMEVETGGDE